MRYFRCWNDDEPCFARNMEGRCKLLNDTYPEGVCPFRKEKIDETNGVRYPYSSKYERLAE